MEKIRRLSKNQISIGTLFAVLVALLLITVSCSYLRRSATSKKAPSPPFEVKDPIISMVMASSIDAKGKIVNPRFTFPPNEPQMTAIVRVGKIKGSQLNVTWYKSSESGDEKLFEHQIQVNGNDRSFSVGKNASGTLLAGTYKVVATLEGQTKEMEFDVSPLKTAQNKTSSSRNEKVFGNQSLMQKVVWDASSQTTPTTPTSSTAAPGSAPVSGQSGTVPPSGATQNGGMGVPKGPWISPSGDLCIGNVEGCGTDFVDSTADDVEVYVFSDVPSQELINAWEGPSSEHQVGLLKSGTDGTLKFDPCWATDKDLPGTKLSFTARLGNQTVTTQATLGDDTLAPRINVVSTPARGTKVKAGDKIKLNVTATEKRSGGPWQTGVKMIQVTAEPGGLVKDPWTNPSNLPKPCSEKTWEQKDEATYKVPNNPPAVIKICALTEDYVGNESSQCGEFFTGDKWEGTWHAMGTHDAQLYGAGGNVRHQETLDATFTFYVAADGTISGKGRASTEDLPGVADECRTTVSPQRFDVPVRIVGKRSATVDGQPVFTLELKPDSVPVTFTSSCPKGTGTAACNWPQCAESQCGWHVTMLAKDPSTKEEETLHACGPNNLTQIKVTIRRAHP